VSVEAKLAITRAAASLFAARGIETPSLREIARAAEQGNTNAAQYHFGDRDGLLLAVLDRRETEVDLRRAELLDGLDPAAAGAPRALAAALVEPYVPELSDPDGGPEHLRILAEVVARPARFAAALEQQWARPSVRRWSALVEPVLPPEAVGRPLHRRFAVIRFVHGELASRARDRGGRRDHRLFASHLTDLVAAMLAAPVSPATAELIQPTRGARS
jgi:AcrR family transcriptional regulator